MIWFEILNCPYYQKLKFSQKFGRFYEVNWIFAKFELSLLSRDEIFAKLRQFCWTDLKIRTTSIMTGFNFLKNKGVFMISPDNLKCSYYYELKFSQKYPIFDEAIWTFECPIIIRYNSIKCKAVLMISLLLTPSTFSYYHKVKFSLK